ncbi:hypothetical protein [Wukongibacter sp. M2B1]|uniref:hypothetical protein n=1 Tax=Wukongibacter sp. M2B1 TaxID=3088895 RepID=UPI003D7AD5C2
MKKTYILIVILIIGCIGYIGVKRINGVAKLPEIEKKFSIIDETISSDKMANEAIKALKDYLESNKLTSEDIKRISSNITTFKNDDVCIIEYRQPPDLYGNSGRSSWKILQFKNNKPIVVFEKNRPLDLIGFKVIEGNKDDILFTYNENHEVNHRKIQVLAYNVTDNKIEDRQSLNKSDLSSDIWEIDVSAGLIWNRNNFSIYIDNISQDGKEVLLVSVDGQGNKQKLLLSLDKNNQYIITNE